LQKLAHISPIYSGVAIGIVELASGIFGFPTMAAGIATETVN